MKDAGFDEFLDRLRSESDIVAVISDYVSLKKKGRNYWGCCPFHQENTPSFSVNPEKGFYYCFGCQSGGNVFSFLMKVENIAFMDAVRLLAKKMNIPIPERQKTPEQIAREKEMAQLGYALKLARDFFHSCLVRTSYGKEGLAYLKRRGITDEMIETFQLGFAPNAWSKLTDAFKKRGISEETLVAVGLAVHNENKHSVYDRFRNRVMFPICDLKGRVCGFGGRVLDDSQPKYLNSSESLVFNKRQILFGYDTAYQAIKASGQAIVMEGYMDVLSARKHGICNTVASLGTAFTPAHAKLLKKAANEIIFSYDSDRAGQNATDRALQIVRELGMSLRVLTIPDGKDPDEFLSKHGKEAFQKLVDDANTYLEYRFQQILSKVDYSDLQGKVNVVSQVVELLAGSNNAVETNVYIARTAEVLAIDESSVRSELYKYMNKKDNQDRQGQDITIRSAAKKPEGASLTAERNLISMICSDGSMIPYIKAQISEDTFSHPENVAIVTRLWQAWEQESSLTKEIDAMMAEPSLRDVLSNILLEEPVSEDMIQMVDDCIRTIRLTHYQKLYEQHRLKADELERMGDSGFLQELAQSQRIKDEINKLRNQQ